MLRRRETSADTAARFLASREGKPKPYRRPAWRPSGSLADHLARAERFSAARAVVAPAPRRIACDFAEPTLRAIHEALLEQIMSGHLVGDSLHRTLIAEHMVAVALGEPTYCNPPLTDREVR